MVLSEEQLAEIEERHAERRSLRAQLPPGKWLYESFAFLENWRDRNSGVVVGQEDRVSILIRRHAWIESLIRAYGSDVLDRGTASRTDKRALLPAWVGQYLKKQMDGSAENDIALLLGEIRRLRHPLRPKGPSVAES